MAAPLVPGTTKADVQLWMIRLYRNIAGNTATVEHACALLHRHPLANGKNICALARVAWNRSSELEPLSDTGNAQRLAILSGTEIAHDPAVGWRIWADSVWRGDPDGTVVQRWAKRVAPQLNKEAGQIYTQARRVRANGGDDARREAEKLEDQAGKTKAWGLASQSAKLLGAMAKLVRDEPGVLTGADQWDASSSLLACPGAIIELRDDGHVIRAPRRADRLTKITRGRPGTGAPAPLLEAFLVRSLPDEGLRLYVQKLLGYGLYGGNPRRLMLIFLGKTSTGKTTIGEIVRHVLDDYAWPFNLSLFRGKLDEGPRSDVVKALGRRMVFASEVSQRWQLHADEVKRLTGGDSVQARDLYAKADATVERRPMFLPVLSANAVPTILGADAATRRRLVGIPWEQQIDPAQEDPDLGEKIRTQEADGVLDYLLHGWDLYRAFGLGGQPKEVVETTMKLFDSLTVHDRWLVDETEQDDSYSATNRTLWGAFSEWCKTYGISDEQRGNNIGFGRWLADRGFNPAKIDGQRGWKGLRPAQSEVADHQPE